MLNNFKILKILKGNVFDADTSTSFIEVKNKHIVELNGLRVRPLTPNGFKIKIIKLIF